MLFGRVICNMLFFLCFRKKSIKRYIQQNVVLKLVNREVGVTNKKLICQCEFINYHNYLLNEHFITPVNEHVQPCKWISTKNVKRMTKMQNDFNQFFENQFNTAFPIKQITYCLYHNIMYKHTDRKQVFSKTKWLGQIYYTKYSFTTKTYSTQVKKCTWSRYFGVKVIF